MPAIFFVAWSAVVGWLTKNGTQLVLLAKIAAAVVAVGVLVRLLFQWLWDELWRLVAEYLLYFVDPVFIVDLAFKLLGWLLDGLGWLLPGDVGAAFTAVGGYVEDVTVRNMFAVLLWFLSPICSPSVILGAFRAMIGVWVVSLVIYVIFWFKHELPGGGSQ